MRAADKGHQIRSVRAYYLPGPYRPAATDKDPAGHWLGGKIANPMTRYAEFRDNRDAAIGAKAARGVVVLVESASGHVGVGQTVGGTAAAAIVEEHLAYLVEGESAFSHSRLWDRMFSSTLRYGRKGIVLHAISAVDNAIWDLHGKITEQPVHALLGGKIRDRIEVYATGPNVEAAASFGFAGAKFPLVYAPTEGEQGFRANLALAEEARRRVPDEFPLMCDCWMALDVDYAVRLAHALEPLGVRWIEEPLVPDDYAGLRRLRDRFPPSMLLATGEHEYTAAGFKLLCEAGVDIVQPDPNWCGGLTELLRISAVASTYGVRVVPHAGGQVSYQFVATRPDGDLAEFLMYAPDGHALAPQHAPLLRGEWLPVDGLVTVGDEPGFGLALSDNLELRGIGRPA